MMEGGKFGLGFNEGSPGSFESEGTGNQPETPTEQPSHRPDFDDNVHSQPTTENRTEPDSSRPETSQHPQNFVDIPIQEILKNPGNHDPVEQELAVNAIFEANQPE